MEGRTFRKRAGEWSDDPSEEQHMDNDEEGMDVINISDAEVQEDVVNIISTSSSLGPSQSVSTGREAACQIPPYNHVSASRVGWSSNKRRYLVLNNLLAKCIWQTNWYQVIPK